MNILITGGAGFIGSNLAAYYLAQHHHVTVFDSLSRPEVGRNILWLQREYGDYLSIVTQDVRNYDAVSEVVKHADVIFHQAGHPIIQTALSHPRYDFEVNGLGTLNILEAIRCVNPAAVLFYSSTSKVYGIIPQSKTKVSETHPLDFLTPYGCSSGAADQYVQEFNQTYNVKTVIFRQSVVYGERQYGIDDQDWLVYCIAQSLKRLPVTLHGDGKQISDILYIGDLVKAYDKALQSLPHTIGQIFNIGGGPKNAVSQLEIIQEIETLIGKKITLDMKSPRLGEVPYYVSNTAKAKRQFGWQPETGYHEGIRKLYHWMENLVY